MEETPLERVTLVKWMQESNALLTILPAEMITLFKLLQPEKA